LQLPVLFGKPPELDQSRLLRMQFQIELRQTFSKLFEETLGSRRAFEAHHKIVGASARVLRAPSGSLRECAPVSAASSVLGRAVC
jgi:hypothetical protein